MSNIIKSSVSVGDDVVAIKRSDVSKTIVANIIGRNCNEKGEVIKIYLDRIVHKPTDRELGEWHVTGAISTIMYA